MTVPSDATAEIRLIDLEKRFGAIRAVDGVSLEVRAGEFAGMNVSSAAATMRGSYCPSRSAR